MENWISVQEASKIKGCTPANINYYIKQGKVEATKIGGRWHINPESLNFKKETNKPTENFDSVLEVFKSQLEEKDKQIEKLQEQLSQAHQLVAMEKQERLQLLEDKRPWWRRKKKANS
jgi:predicted RNase H-like nuclease (RuvC/YqgF family)